VSRRRYLLRRLGAAGVVLIGVATGAWLVSAALGSDDGSSAQADGSPAPTTSAQIQVSAVPGTASAAPPPDTDPPPSAVPVTDPRPARTGPPSADDPARVLIVGDSDAGTFGPYLQQLLRETGVVETSLEYKVSSGLARPDFYDWNAELRRLVPASDPDIVVVTFGGNDAQFLADANGASVVSQARPDSDNVEWKAEYAARAGAVMDYLADGDRSVIWVGIPNHINPEVTFRMQAQDDAVRQAVAGRSEIRFIDTWNRFRGRNGNFAEFLVDPRDGQGKPVRASDGFHLNQVGAEILAIDIFEVVADELRSMGAAI
jgi:uncharacterized protein